jgi:UDP-glucuronate 4-epimerase
MSRILVTGGAGFIGSHVAEALLSRGEAVTILDSLDPYYDVERKRANLKEVALAGDFEWVEGDIRDRSLLTNVFERGFDGVIHLAARAGVRMSIEAPLDYVSTNLDGTANLLSMAVQHRISRFVFASSSSVYGNSLQVPFRESDPVMEPVSPYAATKRGGELLCHSWHHCHGLAVTCLRFFTVYGPRQRPDMAIHKFVARILRDQEIPFFGDGKTRRDYTYVDDVVDGVIRAFDRCGGFRIYNLGESVTTSLDELVGILEACTGKRAIRKREPFQMGDVQETFADISKARAELGYDPHTTVQQGVTRFVDWFSKWHP